MRSVHSHFLTCLRVGYAIALLGINLYAALADCCGVVPALTPPTEAARSFMDALSASGFFVPLLGATYLVGAIALLIPRTAPFGILVLTPPMVVIFFFHMFLTGMVWWAAAWVGGLALLGWGYRDAFRGLVNFKGQARF